MSCPANPPAPAGYDVWKGAVPAALSAWAVQLLKGVSKVPFGTTWTMDYGGMAIMARKDYHTWHYQPDGTLLTDICWPGITLYKPLPTGVGGSGGAVVTNIETATPYPTLAVYDNSPQSTDWGLVGLCATAIAGVVGLVWAALKKTGRR